MTDDSPLGLTSLDVNNFKEAWKVDGKSDFKEVPGLIANAEQVELENKSSQSTYTTNIKESLDIKYSELLLEQKVTLVKIEKNEVASECDKLHEISFEDWQIKKEEVDIKEEEDVNISEVRYEHETLPSNSTTQNVLIKIEPLEERNLEDCNHEKKILKKSAKNEQKKSLPDFIEKNPVSKDQLQGLLKPRKNPKKDGRLFICDKCNYQTIRKGDLTRHQKRKHINKDEAPVFKCYYCNYQSLYKAHLKSHMLKHRHKNHNCDQCDFQTPRKDYLKRHRIVHQNPDAADPFKCNRCDFVTLRKKSLAKHMLGHECFKDVDKFKCNQCNYESIWRSHLKTHLIIHKRPEEIEMLKVQNLRFSDKFKKIH